jgi:hypothetical protein
VKVSFANTAWRKFLPTSANFRLHEQALNLIVYRITPACTWDCAISVLGAKGAPLKLIPHEYTKKIVEGKMLFDSYKGQLECHNEF